LPVRARGPIAHAPIGTRFEATEETGDDRYEAEAVGEDRRGELHEEGIVE
jgi:hypothetical protein